MRILLSGFEPFGGSKVNPSQRVVEALASRGIPGAEIVPLLLPVVGEVAPRRLLWALRAHAPDAVVCLGESGRAAGLVVERVAVNLRDYRIPDNRGRVKEDAPVVRGGPAAYFATLPVRAMVEAIRAVGVPATLSLSAGSFLCNETMYALLHASSTSEVRGGFIHLPRLPEQGALDMGQPMGPTMDLLTCVGGVEAALRALLRGSSRRGRSTVTRAGGPGPSPAPGRGRRTSPST